MSSPRATQQSRPLRWLAWPLLAAWLGCVSPTLPPDDPPEPEVELGVGVAYLRGAVAAAPAFVLVHNRATGLIFGQRTATGAYAFEVQSEPCDLLALWYESGSFQSSAVTFFPAEVAGTPDACRNRDTAGAADAGR
jgi:hypothetical protein